MWTFQTNGTYGQTGPGGSEFYKGVKADLIGADFDGIANVTKYPGFEGAIDNLPAFVAANGFKGFTIPEFVHPRISTDLTGSERAAWAETWAGKFKAAGAVAVHLYDYDYRPAQVFAAGSLEHAAWKRVLAG